MEARCFSNTDGNSNGLLYPLCLPMWSTID